jgi:hypothetical protein
VPDTQFRVYIDNVSVTPNAAGNTGEVHDANAK